MKRLADRTLAIGHAAAMAGRFVRDDDLPAYDAAMMTQSLPFARYYEALREANRGYLAHYHEYRDVMRAFMEAAHVDARFRDIWWSMRLRHVDRFVAAVRRVHGLEDVDGFEVELVAPEPPPA